MNVTLPETTLARRDKSAVATAPSGPLGREMRTLLASLLRLIDEQGSIVVYLSSARGGDGTTTIARALAATAAYSRWCNVALLEVARPPAANLIDENSTAMQVTDPFEQSGGVTIRRLRTSGVEFGYAAINLVEPFVPNIESIRTLYQRVRQEYTLVIVDAPPILESRDTGVLAALADASILVVTAERTRLSDVERARDILDALGATVLGAVLNKRRQRLPRFVENMV